MLKGGGGKSSFTLSKKRGGGVTTSFGVVLTQALEVLVMLRVGGGGGQKRVPCLEVKPTIFPSFILYPSPPPPQTVIMTGTVPNKTKTFTSDCCRQLLIARILQWLDDHEV